MWRWRPRAVPHAPRRVSWASISRRDAAALASRKCAGGRGWPRIALVRGDATRLSAGGHSVDAATIAFGIRNVQQPELACRELARVVRPGGGSRSSSSACRAPGPGSRRLSLVLATACCRRSAALVSRHGSAYAYLPESVGRFPPPEEFGQMLQESGFPHVTIVPLTFGIVYLYVAER